MGYILPWGNPDAPTYLYTTPFNFSMGQILSFAMILIGVGIIVFGKRAARLAEERASAEAAMKARVKSSSKKLGKKHK